MDCAVHGFLQARILEWVAFPISRGSSQPRDWTQVSCIAGGFFTSWATREAPKWKWKSLSYVWLFVTHGLYSPWNSPGQDTGVGSLSLLQGIFLTPGSNPGLPHCRQILYQLSHQGSPRILEWAAYPFSRRSSWPRNWTRVSFIAGGFFTNYQGKELSGKPNRDSRENELNTRHFCYLSGFCYQNMSWASTHCQPLREISLILQWWSWPWVPSSQQSLQIEIMFIKTLCKTESALEMSAIIHSNCISASSIPSLNNSFTSLQTHRHFFNFLFL